MYLWRIYLRVLRLLAPERTLAIFLALANLALACVLFTEPILFGHVVDALVHPKAHQLALLIGAWALVGFGGVAMGVLVSLHADRMAHRRRMAAIRMFFAHTLALPLAFHREHHSGRLQRIMTVGVDDLFTLWLSFFREHLTTLLSIVVLIPVALWINWRLALLMIALLAGFAAFNLIAVRRNRVAQGEVQEHFNAIATRTGDVLGNVAVVQSFTRVDAEVCDLKQLTERALAVQYPVLSGWAALSVATRAASTLTVVAIFIMGAALHAKGQISIGGIVSFVGFSLMLIGRLEQFASFISNLFFQSQSLKDFFEVLDTRAGPLAARGALPLTRVRGDVRFEHVGFSYDGKQSSLDDLSFHAPPGSRVALVGPTGAGKSTTVSLLYRAYDPDRGRITIDGRDIRSVDIESLRQNVTTVFQEAGLFQRSIEDNLRVGDPAVGTADIEVAARAAEAHDFIAAKPDGYATRVAERGRSLSGGERQRLAIARAMLKGAPILILDEATSALDTITEARVQRALDRLTVGRTTFIIAHRLSTIRDADWVLVLDHGRLVEQGTYDDLIARGGMFARLAAQGGFAPTADAGAGPRVALEVAA
ncbi:MAG TPA: glucan ABC transporter ATP-binding protein/ permease [Rhodanobacteraceae bacterium]|nr:glucan ABC transporter ATP-binding protein/ permease [Rhodanobacteraceae bacterium]